MTELLLFPVLNVLIVTLLLIVYPNCQCSFDTFLPKSQITNNRVSVGYLTPEKCNRSDRTRLICKLLSKSKKFKTIDKYAPKTGHFKIETKPFNNIKKRRGLLDTYDYDDDDHHSRVFTGRNSDNFVDSDEDTNSFNVPEDIFKIYEFPSLTKHNQKYLRIPRLRQLRPFKMKKVRNIVWPKVLKVRNKLAEMPLAVSGIPLFWTLGVALMLKHQLKKGQVTDIPIPQKFPLLDSGKLPKIVKERNATAEREKFQLTKEIISLTGESLNLAANKIDFINVLARTLQPVNIGSFLAAQRLKVNSTLLNNVKNFRGNEGNLTNLVGEFVREIANQAVRNVTENMSVG